ncbi:Mgm101p-domain-containing protein [Annulohypoxylon bovei var. microspora]|nr:Mgm101p-domain-containing protein [Annulohypoxylon bovei var. microspora]
MASRTLTPLRAASRRLQSTASPQNWAQIPARTLISASKAKPYQIPPSARPSSTPTPPKAATPLAPSRPAPAPTPAPARTPVPAVSGVPLPDAPSQTPASENGSDNGGAPIDWTQSFHGLGTSAFGAETSAVLQARLDPDDIEVKPDGIIYLPEIKYRRILNAAFGPGGWGLAPRGQLMVHEKLVTREYALVVHGRFVGQARGEQQYFSEDGVSTAAEGCKSNALMRCCKDLGIASELWDPRFIRKFMKEHAMQQWVEHVTTKKKKQIWLRKDDEVRYPFKKS